MGTIKPSRLLRQSLVLDAVATTAMGLGLVALADAAAPVLGIRADILRVAGASLVPFGALVGYLASRRTLPSSAVWFVVGYNAVWAVDSVIALPLGWLGAAPLGVAFVLAQAAAVAFFAGLEFAGFRSSEPALAG